MFESRHSDQPSDGKVGRDMAARIYSPAKNAMQSGKAQTQEWLLVFDPSQAKRQDPMMGWAGWGNTQEQVMLRFPTREAAVAYCQKYGIEHVVDVSARQGAGAD